QRRRHAVSMGVAKMIFIAAAVVLAGCGQKSDQAMNDDTMIKLMVLDPGHFHASLVQKKMYPGVDSTVYVYAPEGMELNDYLARVESYNSREENPTAWDIQLYTGDDFLEKMLEERPGNLVMLAGNNRNKTEYIVACIDAGLHVYSDKPMAIEPAAFEQLKGALDKAASEGLLLYDIMTERFEITTMLQKELSEQEQIFGGLVEGTEGWIFVSRGSYQATASDPVTAAKNSKALDAGDPSILTSEIGEDEIRLYRSDDQHGDWLDSVLKRKDPVSPVEPGHRACATCLISHIAMKVPGKLRYDPVKERFTNSEEANAMLSRPDRAPYGLGSLDLGV
ncbi:MAG: hypothetical protein LC655_03815, partial [Bacteroidales bacterium]|nr:hypothetical protein [Bacteroidales bacterium]